MGSQSVLRIQLWVEPKVKAWRQQKGTVVFFSQIEDHLALFT